jgi:long-chain acyl-CoA synthetase
MTEPRHTVPDCLLAAAEVVGDKRILIDRGVDVTLGTLLTDAAALAEGLRQQGVKPGDRVGLYADNSRRWILCDLAIQCARGVSVPRGTDTPVEEYAGLLAHAQAGLVLVHAARHAAALEACRDQVPSMGTIVTLDPKDAPGLTVDALVEAGRGGPDFKTCAAAIEPDDLATIIYTSGTTGRPKGVMLTQANFAHQVLRCPEILNMQPGERFLSILPPWHIFERTVEYIALCMGCELAYTDRRRFRDDLGRYEPTFVPSVPRLWESVYDAVQKKVAAGSPVARGLFRGALAVSSRHVRFWERLHGHHLRVHKPTGVGVLGDLVARGAAALGLALTWLPTKLAHAVVFKRIKQVTGSRLRGAISGGGLMPPHIDRFFQAIGVPILVGYGLTETSPVISLRRETRNVLGTIGVPIPEVEIQVRDVETKRVLGPGEKGVIHTRGPHVMRGYYQDEALTRSVIDDDGWFDTGDLVYLTDQQDICFVGRAKETIVLSGGENVEPERVEAALLASPLIEQAIVVGQDRKTIAVLLWPDVEAAAARLGLEDADAQAVLAHPGLHDVLKTECRERTSSLSGFERIARLALLPEPLDAANGCLTQTLKPRRHVIVERFADRIEEAYR